MRWLAVSVALAGCSHGMSDETESLTAHIEVAHRTPKIRHAEVSGTKPLRPEVLQRVLERTGAEFDLSSYTLALGGLDYMGVTERSTELGPTMPLVMNALADQYCDTVTMPESPSADGCDSSQTYTDEEAGIRELYAMIRGGCIDHHPGVQAHAFALYNEVATDPERAVCVYLFLVDGSVLLY